MSYSDPFGLCPGIKGTDPQNADDCPDESTRGFWDEFFNGPRYIELDGKRYPLAKGVVPSSIGGAEAAEAELGAIETSFGNITDELKTSNHFQAARLERTGRLNTGYDHANELQDFANGLRNYATRLKKMLGDQNIGAVTRERAQRLLSDVSKLRDRIMETLRQ